MNKIDLEKMFDEKFGDLWNIDFRDDGNENTYKTDDVKQFIFDIIIHEVLKSIMVNTYGYTDHDCIEAIKQKVKKLYNINL